MRTSLNFPLPAPRARVLALLASPEWQRERYAHLLVDPQVRVEERAGAAEGRELQVHAEGNLLVTLVPEALRRFVPPTLPVRVEETWTSTEEETRGAGRLETGSAPVWVRIDSLMRDRPKLGTCDHDVTLDIEVTVPFVGPAAEATLTRALTQALEEEAERVSAHLMSSR